jgi:predicted metal-dependent peptidase
MSLFTHHALSAEQRVQKAVVDIMNKDRYVALAGVLMLGSKEVRDDIPTAATNGRDEAYGRTFVEQLNDAELRFVVLHECYHKLFRHLTTWKHLWDEDAQLANTSCDYVINLMIVEDNKDGFAVIPKDKQGNVIGLIDKKYVGMDSEQVFKLLKKNQDQSQGQGQGQGQGQQGFDEHDWEGAAEMSDEEQQQLAEDIDEAVRQGALTAGKLGTGGNRAIDSLLQPEVDWKEVLREFVTTTCVGSDYSTYSRPNRRYASSDTYMPSGVSQQVDELVVAIDTSGSIGQPELTKFLSEIQGVVANVNPRAVRVLYWDTKVCADEMYENETSTNTGGMPLSSLTSSTKPAGGGGTDVRCVNTYMQDNQITAQAVIVLTDGHLGGDWGSWSAPVLWCILSHKSAMPTVGEAIHITL